jgi:non-specific serine/threonine protein kinase
MDLDRAEQLVQTYLRQRATGVLLLGDDVEKLDSVSLELLNRLTTLESPHTLGLILAATPGFRQGQPPPHAPLREAVYLEPLSRDGIRAFVRGFLHWEAPEPLLGWLVTQSRGLPGDVQRIVEALVSSRQIVQEGRSWALSPGFAGAVGAAGAPGAGLHPELVEAVEPFFGREGEMYRLKHLLERARLITFTGPGGVGKTRLGLRLAHEQRERFRDGVCFVSLAALSAPEHVGPALALAVRAATGRGRTCIEALKDHLGSQQILLVLDNFEQVVGAASVVTDLLSSCPEVHVIVTSRVRLGVFGETPFPVEPLPVPNPDRLPATEALPEYSGVALFLARARRSCPDFVLTPDNAPLVAALCHRLEGLPLALELAAARMGSGGLGELLAALKSPLELVGGTALGEPDRHQSLEAAIRWSFRLLPASAGRLFARLAVFRGGWTSEAAASVAYEVHPARDERPVSPGFIRDGGSPPTFTPADPAHDVETLLELLADHSLIRREPSGGRYAMLETIREYALEQLIADGELERTRAAHARSLLDLIERTEPELTGARQAEALDTLEAEHANVRAALEWWVSRGETLSAMRAVGALWRFWTTRGYLVEGAHWTEQALATDPARMDGVFQAARGKALLTAGILNQFLGEFTQARDHLMEARRCCEEAGHRPTLASVHNNLGNVAQSTGDLDLAYRHWNASLQLRRELNDRSGCAVALHNLAGVAYERGDVQDAVRMYEESLQLWRELGDRLNTGNSLLDLSAIARQGGDLTRAMILLEQCADGWLDLGYAPGLTILLDTFGDVALERGAVTRAVQLWGAAESAREALGQPGENARVDHSRKVSDARRALDACSFQSHWDAGRQLGVDEALVLARTPIAVEPAPN